MRRLYQLLKSRYLKWKEIRKELARLKGEALIINSRRVVDYRQEAMKLQLMEARNERKLAASYYLGQIVLLNWILGGEKDPKIHDATD